MSLRGAEEYYGGDVGTALCVSGQTAASRGPGCRSGGLGDGIASLAFPVLHMQGILVPAAAGGVGLVISAYEQRTHLGQLRLTRSEDLTPALYTQCRCS